MSEKLAEKLAKIQSDSVDKVIRLADDYGIERDKLILVFLTTLTDVAKSHSFKEYEIGGNENE